MRLNAMQALELDFSANQRRSPWVGRALLVAALAFGAHVTASYVDLRGRIDEGEARLDRLGRPAEGAGNAPARNVSQEELREARETLQRLSLAWGNLFGALEGASKAHGEGAGVALLTIEPEARAGTVLIGGEAKDYAAVLQYVSRLAASGTLRDVYLVRHELRQADSPRPLAFTVSASWKEAR